MILLQTFWNQNHSRYITDTASNFSISETDNSYEAKLNNNTDYHNERNNDLSHV